MLSFTDELLSSLTGFGLFYDVYPELPPWAKFNFAPTGLGLRK